MLVENTTNTPFLSVEAPIIEDKPSESTPDQSQQVKMEVNLILSLEGPPSDDTVTKENENDTIQILFINIESNEHGEIYLFLQHRKEVRRRFIRQFIWSLLQAT